MVIIKEEEIFSNDVVIEPDTFPLNFQGHIRLGDVRMSDQDFKTLHGEEELEDNVILFFLEFLRQIRFSENQNEIEILGPSLVHFLQIIESPEQLEALNLMNKKFVFAVILSLDPYVGHWSLLVFIPPGQFYHMDSMKNINYNVAKTFSEKLTKALNIQEATFRIKLVDVQDNSFDCGICVLENFKNTLEHILEEGKSMEDEFKIRTFKFTSSEKRQELLEIVQSLADRRTQGQE